MYSIHIKKRLSDWLALAALLLFLALEVVGCKDMEDCRSLYHSDFVLIEFKGSSPLARDHVDVELPTGLRKNLEDMFAGSWLKKTIPDNLKNLKEKRLPLSLDDQHRTIKLYLYKTPTDPQPDTITFHYYVKHALLSPNCGIQRVFVIEKVETSFGSSTIVAPGGKVTKLDTAGNNKPHVEILY
jgi:hypothetical protein